MSEADHETAISFFKIATARAHKDNGLINIPLEHVDKIFELFVQAVVSLECVMSMLMVLSPPHEVMAVTSVLRQSVVEIFGKQCPRFATYAEFAQALILEQPCVEKNTPTIVKMDD